jgi:hypothetical protein
MRTLVKMVYVLSSVDFEEHRSVFDGLAVASFDRQNPPWPVAAHRVADAKRFDEGELSIGLEQIAFRRQRPAQVEDSHQVGPDKIGPNRVRVQRSQILGDLRNQVRMERSPPQFDLFAVALDPQPQEIGLHKQLGQGTNVPGNRGEGVLVGHRR